MTIKRLPPVRRAVPIFRSRASSKESQRELINWAKPYELSLFGSGTEALAAALIYAKRLRDTPVPEVILPAYGCPDLIAACLFAGVSPRLVDVWEDGWGYDEALLKAAVNSNTVAIVAVNLLGVGDQGAQLRRIADQHQLMLVQDSAQYLPERGANWVGDAVVLSFGRGKPLNLLGGGGLLARSRDVESIVLGANNGSYLGASRLLGLAFNVATHPRVYWFTSLLSGFHVGATRFVPLNHCRRAAGSLTVQLASALRDFAGKDNYSAQKWAAAVDAWRSVGIDLLRCAGEAKSDHQYLRLPLLAATEQDRDRLVSVLTECGLGATSMYQQTLTNIAGVPAVSGQGPFRNAEALARRLFTLPTYDFVDASTISQVERVVRHVVR